MNHAWRAEVEAIVAAALAAADPESLVRRACANDAPACDGVLAIGKAAPGMFEGFSDNLRPPNVLMLIPEGVHGPSWAVRADHPVPTERNVAAAERVSEFARAMSRRPRGVVVLISGGASALLSLPAEGLSLGVVREVTQALLSRGADIHQLNCVRKHIEQLKGGRLAALLAPAPVQALVLSDVVGDDPATIGSGPVSADPTTFADAASIVAEFAPHSFRVLEYLQAGARGDFPETPKPGDAMFDHVRVRIIGNNHVAMDAAERAAVSMGYRTVATLPEMTGEAAEVGRRLARMAVDSSQHRGTAGARCCIILGGETTVTLGDAPGKGGRNQELALAAAEVLHGAGVGDSIAIAAFATDGVDGPTDAAGAMVTGTTWDDSKAAGLDPAKCLRKHDSHTLFARLSAHIRTGPTGTNVNDVAFALIR